MKTLACFLEEPSAAVFLRGILPSLLPDGVEPRFIKFQGKQDMEKNLLKKLRGWNQPDTLFLIMRDQDTEDCKAVKNRLTQICADSVKTETLVRIACRELESFYLGDLDAVGRAFDLPKLMQQQDKQKYRNPDRLENPARELRNLTGGQYQKIQGSRKIAPLLKYRDNHSTSFRALLNGIETLVQKVH